MVDCLVVSLALKEAGVLIVKMGLVGRQCAFS